MNKNSKIKPTIKNKTKKQPASNLDSTLQYMTALTHLILKSDIDAKLDQILNWIFFH